MALFSWQKKKKEDGTEELELSKEAQEQMDKATAAAAELPVIKDSLSKVNEFIDAFKREQDEKKAAEQQKQQQQSRQQSDEEFETLMLTDPQAAMQKAMLPTNQALLTLRADNMRREMFEDADKFKYYHGDIKREIDQLLASQTLEARNNPSVIENTYHTVVGKHHEEIMEGKLKTRFAGSEGGSKGTSSGNAGDRGTGEKTTPVITDEIRKLAKTFGVTPEDYAQMLINDGVEYV